MLLTQITTAEQDVATLESSIAADRAALEQAETQLAAELAKPDPDPAVVAILEADIAFYQARIAADSARVAALVQLLVSLQLDLSVCDNAQAVCEPTVLAPTSCTGSITCDASCSCTFD